MYKVFIIYLINVLSTQCRASAVRSTSLQFLFVFRFFYLFMFILLFIFAAFAAFPRRVTVIICALALWPHTHTQTRHPQSDGGRGCAGERPAHMCDHRAWQHFGLIEVNPWLALTIFYAWLPFAIPRSPFPVPTRCLAIRFDSIPFRFRCCCWCCCCVH